MATKPTSPLVWLGLALVVAVGLMALFAALFMPYRSGYGYGMMGWGMGWGAVFMIVPALFLILILWVALGASAPTPTYVASVPNAMDELNARYARGEISRDEYLRIRTDVEAVGRYEGGRR